MSLHTLKEAIESRKSVSFNYNKPGKVQGQRIGNPHAIWVMRKKDGSESTKVHIVQTAGVSDSGQELPSFRMFDLEVLGDVEVLDGHSQFAVSQKYNPEWEGYTFVIAKV